MIFRHWTRDGGLRLDNAYMTLASRKALPQGRAEPSLSQRDSLFTVIGSWWVPGRVLVRSHRLDPAGAPTVVCFRQPPPVRLVAADLIAALFPSGFFP